MTRARRLTAGEKALATSVFGRAIELDDVELRRTKWWPLQPRNVVMAPCGHLHFHPRGILWREDFSTASLPLRRLFVHELCHVWQSQRGLFLPLRRLPFARYSYTLRPGKPLRRYGIEQQAEIVADAYLIRDGGRPAARDERRRYDDLLAQLEP